ncbi:MAG: hypothetical protein ACQEP7_07730 [bacterium]
MKELMEIDFVIVSRVKDESGQLKALEGRVVEKGVLRDQSLELPVSQVMEYIGRGGTFYTGLMEEENLDLGGKLEVQEEEEQLRLRTVDGTEEKYHLVSLPVKE